MWVDIKGYRWPYRIDEEGCVEKYNRDRWVRLKPYVSGRARACVKMRTKEDKKVDVPVVNLMANAFMGGKEPGECIIHRNGLKLECHLNNLRKVTYSECGKLSSRNRRKAVAKVTKGGKVIEIYASSTEAAKKNHLSQTAMYHRCNNLLKNPYKLDGTTYQFI